MKRRSDYVEISRALLEELYYHQGLDANEIGRRFGISGSTVRNRMKEYGMERRGHWDYLYIDIPKAELEQLYIQENRTAPEIAKLYGCATSVVYRRLQEHGIEIKPGGWDKVKRIVPDERLEWSPTFAYIVGLIASDGSLQNNVNEVRFVSTDRELVEYYCSCLGLRPHDTDPVQWGALNATEVYVRIEQKAHYKRQYHLVFSDHIYRARLEAIGLTPSKSNTLGALKIPDEYFCDFLRGEFDGDGCWSISNKSSWSALIGIFTSGSRAYLEWMQATILRLTGLKGYFNGIDLRFQGKQAALLGEFLYYSPMIPSLTRKRSKWETWMKQKSIETSKD